MILNMLNTIQIFRSIKLIGVIIGFCSCTCVQSPKVDEGTNGSRKSKDASSVNLNDKKTVLYLIPSPGEILVRFQDAHISFNEGLINPVSNKNNYFGSIAQSLNLGIYISDLAYLTLFQRAAETVDYLETIQSLSYEVGISSSVFESLMQRAKDNAGNMDSLFVISNEAYNDLIGFLEEGGKENTVVMISAGAFVESLYLALLTAGEFSADNKVSGFIADMRYPLDNILERASIIKKDDTNIENIFNSLNSIKLIFNELDSVAHGITVKGDKKGSLTIQGGKRLTMNEQVFNKLMQKVPEIRNNIISN